MSLSQIEINNFRNLLRVNVAVGQKFNVFYGANGSGKTSLLEAIHYLSLARSFRTHLNHRLINNDNACFSIIGQVQQGPQTISVGIERQRDGEGQIRIGGENVTTVTELAKTLPIQLLNADTHRLLLSGPKYRRQLIDWGVFHVEPTFLSIWQRAYRALKQRNAALKARAPKEQVVLWNSELITVGKQLDEARKRYVAAFSQQVSSYFATVLANIDINLNYQRGWPPDRDLAEILNESLIRDYQLGYTQFGPHRADLVLRIGNAPAQDWLSQGQQKLLTYAMRLAQGVLLKAQTQKNCVYLIDDLPAELDSEKQQRVANLLASLDSQVFVTGIELAELRSLFDSHGTQLFHVEQGSITQTEEAI